MDNLEEQLKIDEGKRNIVYKDSTGVLTIGYGRNLQTRGLTDEECLYLLTNDIKRVRAELLDISWYLTLTPARQDVIANMTFNMGKKGMLSFAEMVAAINASDWERAANAMLESKWAKQVGERATRLSQMMKTGKYPE